MRCVALLVIGQLVSPLAMLTVKQLRKSLEQVAEVHLKPMGFSLRLGFLVRERTARIHYGTSMEMLARSLPGLGDIVAHTSLVRIHD